mgnify:CR=1 FL=1
MCIRDSDHMALDGLEDAYEKLGTLYSFMQAISQTTQTTKLLALIREKTGGGVAVGGCPGTDGTRDGRGQSRHALRSGGRLEHLAAGEEPHGRARLVGSPAWRDYRGAGP